MSLSRAVVSGIVVKSPEKRFTPSTNVAVTEFTLAVESMPRSDGSRESTPVKVITWRELAERTALEIKKGDFVAVDGRLQFNSYTTQDGQKRREAEIDASFVENLGSKVGGQVGEDFDQPKKVPAKAGAKSKVTSEEEDLDAIFASEDEIPF